MNSLLHDVRYALRALARSPAFAVIAIATLALGLGANTAVFSVVNAVLLKPLPFAEPERLMLVNLLRPDDAAPGVYRETIWSYPKYSSFVERQQAFEDTAVFYARDLTLADGDDPQAVRGEVVSERYPAVLGIQPILGRLFTSDEVSREGAAPVALLGHGLWTDRYGADAGIVGRTIRINAQPFAVVGVLPPGFRGLNGNVDLWVPIASLDPTALTEATNHSFRLVARRKPDVTEQEALAQTRAAGDQVGAELFEADGQRESASAVSLYDSRVDADIRRAALVLLGAVTFVLLIACVNLTHLLIAKTLTRRRELAIRAALGASRGRLWRQFLVESGVLTSFGALGGVGVAALLLQGAAALLPDSDVFFGTSIAPGVPRTLGAAGLTRIGASAIGLDAATLWFAGGIAFAIACFVAAALAMRAAALPPIEVIKATGNASSGDLRDHRARSALLGAQIALAVVLLAGAGLMLRSATALHSTGIGIDPASLLTVRVDLPPAAYAAEQGRAFYAELLERVRALPGVEEASMASCAPVSGGCNQTGLGPVGADDYDSPVGVHWATPEHLSTLGMRVVAGRGFTERDRVGQPKVVLINEAAARALWPNETPIGKTVAVGQGGFHDGAEIVGVVTDVRYRTIESAATPDVYIPIAQSYRSQMRLFVRSRRDPQTLVPAIAAAVRALDANVAAREIKTMETRFGDAMWRTRVGAWLLSGFAGLALLLTAIGIFGVMAQTVAHRTAEIGVRMALGARSGDVLRMILRRAVVITASGLALGTAAALALNRVLGTLLYGVEPHDPLTFIAVVLLLALVALLACYLPARRATQIDAAVALRND